MVRLAAGDAHRRGDGGLARRVNTASRRVLEKAGLTYARTVHLDWPDPLPGNEHGDVEYQLHRTDWPPR